MFIHTPVKSYEIAVGSDQIEEDASQKAALVCLNQLFEAMLVQASLWSQFKRTFFRMLSRPYAPQRGVYLWGGVGRGKTYLMDLFYCSLPFKQKARMHFHRFMYQVHHDLVRLKGTVDPLQAIAKNFAKDHWILCFDEFFVKDIADAMILGGLLQAFFENGVTVVMTSNLPPHDLYQNGLQRDRFLPAIDAIIKYCEIWHLESDTDYRLRYLSQAELYHYPLDAQAEQNLAKYFTGLVRMNRGDTHPLTIAEREIPVRLTAEGVVWFDFDVICHSPRSTVDYIEIARSFHTVLISGLRVMTSESEDVARRFIALVDEFYERNVTLLLSAEAPLDDIYQGSQLKFEFERTQSRLKEMQSQAYIARPHLA
ncbi:MAG: cell division protein ZapE [Gammaproteobacteria bacterium]